MLLVNYKNIMPRGRPKKIISNEVKVPIKVSVTGIRIELLDLLKKKMPACFDREPQGMNSGVEKLADEIINLIK